MMNPNRMQVSGEQILKVNRFGIYRIRISRFKPHGGVEPLNGPIMRKVLAEISERFNILVSSCGLVRLWNRTKRNETAG